MSQAERYMSFSLGEEEYAVPLLQVREVIALPEVTVVPQTPSYFLGIMNLRGQVISVIDLRLKLGFKAGKTKETAVIIFDLGQAKIGVVVDTVNNVLSPTAEDISDRPAGSGNQHEYIAGIYRRTDKLVFLIDMAKALNMTDLAAVQRAQAA